MPHYLSVECRCGRTLRATIDQAGTMIRCWDCHAEFLVPHPATSERLARECLDDARQFLNYGNILAFVVGGLIVGCALTIPVVGPMAGFALLAIAAGLYPELVRQSGRRGALAPPVPVWRIWAARCVWGLALVLGLTAPVLLRHVVMDGYGRLLSWRGPGIAAVAVLCWLALPLGVLLTSASDGAGPIPAHRALAALRRHPVATAVTLLLIPVGLLALEVGVIALLIGQEWFPFLIVDLFPAPGSDRVVLQPLVVHSVQHPGSAPLSAFWRVYVDGLGRGYTLLGSLPASLPRGLFVRATPWFAVPSDWPYLALRVLDSAVILAYVGMLLAIQARWLGLIATVDARSPVRAGDR
jgi:lysylphosphatidylglycerol synthetase-like protein (DUF2156 family)